MKLSSLVFSSALALSITGCDPAGDADAQLLAVDQAGAPTLMAWTTPPIVKGGATTFNVVGAPPSRTITLLGTGALTAPPACPTIIAPDCLEIGGNFQNITQVMSDASGNAVFTLRVPAAIGLSQAKLQAVALFQGTFYATHAATVDFVAPAAEDCNDGIDNDGDELYDCQDSDCTGTTVCNGLVTDIEDGFAVCSDGIDNDGNGFTDCGDFSCDFAPGTEFICGVEEKTNAECDDGIDNDLDGFTDCGDFSCSRNFRIGVCLSVETTEATCADGVDNDGNSLIDCADTSCANATACGGLGITEDTDAACNDGIDQDFDGLEDCDDPDCATTIPCGPPVPEDTDALCSDGFDNDQDNLTDCADLDCQGLTICQTTLEVALNEFLADPDADAVIGDANCDGVRHSADDEFIEIVNTGTTPADLSGAMLADSVVTRHVFPAGTIVPVNGSVVVFGGGTPTFDGSSTNISPWCAALPSTTLVQVASTGAVGLNNGGDSIILTMGGLVFSEAYGAEGGNNQSLVRETELDNTAIFIEHSTAVGAIGPQSPGTRADGTNF